jgi:ABC-type nitrate/sulfonate/bicarbonate transport system permease component
MKSQYAQSYLITFVIAMLLIGGWESVSHVGKTSLFVSSPSLLCKYLAKHYSITITSFVTTAVEACFGLTFAAVTAVTLAMSFYLWPRLLRQAYPWVVATQIIPFVAIAPAVILVFGPSSIWGKIFLSSLVSFFPILSNVLAGLRTVRKESLELMHLLAIGKLRAFKYVVLPHVMHFFFAGLSIAAPLSVIGAVVAEFNGAQYGLGKDIFISAKRLEAELMVTGILGSALLAAAIAGFVKLIESNLGVWYRKEQQ